MLVVAQEAEEGGRADARDVDERDEERGESGRQGGHVARVLGQICLRDSVAGTLEQRGHAVDPEGLVAEELPWDLASSWAGRQTGLGRLGHEDGQGRLFPP